MDTMSQELLFGLLVNLVSSAIGFGIAWGIGRWYFDRCYAGWTVQVVRGEQALFTPPRPISPGKAREIYRESADMSVFLKGVASPYAFINCDIIQVGQKIKLWQVTVEEERRIFGKLLWRVQQSHVIDLEHNPESPRKQSPVAANDPASPGSELARPPL